MAQTVKILSRLNSRQFFEEWEMYHETMTKCGAFTKKNESSPTPLWLDIRGNHDTVNVPNFKEDFYRRFGIIKENRSYWKSLDQNNISIGFVALDATQIPGSRRPFNFFGTVNEEELDQFSKLMSDAQNNTKYQIVIGHYPISCMKPFQLPELTSIISSTNTMAYLCGHLHNHVPGNPDFFFKQNHKKIFAILNLKKRFTILFQEDIYMPSILTNFWNLKLEIGKAIEYFDSWP